MVSEDVYAEATRNGEAFLRRAPLAESAMFDAVAGKIRVVFSAGFEVSFAPASVEEIASLALADLSQVEVWGRGTTLIFGETDAVVYLPALLEGVTGSRLWMESRGRHAAPRAA